jgi:formylglycine-generating enzyme
VNWYDCVKWCNARSEKEGQPVSYRVDGRVYRTGETAALTCDPNVAGYRLPTDTEWEYAARGGESSKRFPWGADTISHSQANYYDLSVGGFHPTYATGGFPYTSPVGAFEMGKNAYGLYDIAGNLLEWCWDWQTGREGLDRVIRGGGWGSGARECQVFSRYDHDPTNASFGIGFRAVLPAGQ